MLTPADMTDAQRAVHDAIATGPRSSGPADFAISHDDGSLVGPFNALVVAGEIGHAVQAVGAAIRFHGQLDAPCRELAILLVAQHRRAAFEWYAHAPIGRRVGLPDKVLEALRRGEVPPLATDALAATHRVTVELLGTGRLTQDSFDTAVRVLGEEQLVELVLVIGYYGMLAGVLNGFAIGAPGVDPFADDQRTVED